MHPIDLAQFWPGYAVVACRPTADNTLLIELMPQADAIPECGRCGQACPLIHERRLRRVRDRDLLDQRVLLQVPVRRVDCLRCGRVTERIAWLEPASRLTRRLQGLARGFAATAADQPRQPPHRLALAHAQADRQTSPGCRRRRFRAG